jgi:hypothetical protein
MSLEDLGNIGEFVAAIGVIISLVYLAVQIRQNTAQLVQNGEEFRVSFRQQQHARTVEINTAIFTNRDVGELIERGLSDLDSLDRADRHRWVAFMNAMFRTFEARHLFASQGLEEMRALRLPYFLKAASTQRFWRSMRDSYEKSFREYVDSMIAEVDAGEGAGESSEAREEST